jgi:type VI secretion system protein ImpF
VAELTPNERLQPCLLDRLTDHEPGRSKESRDTRVFSHNQIRGAVLRDLSWLLNTPTRLDPKELESYPNVRTSVLNYGVPDLCGVVASGLNVTELERIISGAIVAYEPRIMRRTVGVRAMYDPYQMNGSGVALQIAGDLWSMPVPDPLYLKTDLDLESGSFEISEGKARG